MTKLWLDTETYSAVPITYGTAEYARYSQVLIIAWALDDGPVQYHDCEQISSSVAAAPLFDALRDPDVEIWAHNAAFDSCVMRYYLKDLTREPFNFDPFLRLPMRRWHCTASQAREHGLPGSLAALCGVLGVEEAGGKDQAGKALIKFFCGPDKDGERRLGSDHPEKWAQFVAYALQDVVAMRNCAKKMPSWNRRLSRELWLLDQHMARQGVPIDLAMCRGALALAEGAEAAAKAKLAEITGGAVRSPFEVARILTFARTHGLDLEDLQAPKIRLIIDTVPEPVKEVLQIRLAAARSTPKKYATALHNTSPDGRFRFPLVYCGAERSGRFSGTGIQFQNLQRWGATEEQMAELAADITCMGQQRFLGKYPDPLDALSRGVRGLICAPAGYKLVIADLAAIEARVLAWLAGEAWLTKAFADYDRGEGADMYKVEYSNAFGVPVDQVDPGMRFIGKVMRLAFGYQGALGAFRRLAGPRGDQFSDAQIEEFVRVFRAANKATVAYWAALQKACLLVLATGRQVQIKSVLISYDVTYQGLRISLPSGRSMFYRGATTRTAPGGQPSMWYFGRDGSDKPWVWTTTYGGKLAENITQAVARDVFCEGLMAVAAAGYNPILTIHDEIVCLVPDDPCYTPEEVCDLMVGLRTPCLRGLPLAAKGFETRRYRKDD